jgi:cation diffusion facilitator CzcD-associated flavoprotein CzcO
MKAVGMNPPAKAIIAGAGIGELTMVIALRQADFEVTVLHPYYV